MQHIIYFKNHDLEALKNDINKWIADCESNLGAIQIGSTTHIFHNNEHIISFIWKSKKVKKKKEKKIKKELY